MVKAVFFDVDGTLVSFNTHQIPQSTIGSIAQLRAKGIKVFIATGRRMQGIDNVGDLVFDGYITVNGGLCLAGTDKVIYRHCIPQEDIEAMIRYQETVEEFPCAMAQENSIFMNYENKYVKEVFDMLNFPKPPVSTLREAAVNPTLQLIAFFTQEQEERIMAVMPHCDATRWNPLFTDVVPKGSSKSVGIDKILEYYDIPLEGTMAFGDGGNDMQMLQHAGIGVAMGNAEDEVKEVADYVTESVDDDGVYKALKHFGVID